MTHSPEKTQTVPSLENYFLSLLLDTILFILFVVVFYFFFWPHVAACTILVSQPEMELVPPAVKPWNLNHWTASAVPTLLISKELV